MTLPSPRLLTLRDDLPAIDALLTACESFDGLGQHVTLAELEAELLDAEVGWDKEVALWESSGELIAVAALFLQHDRSLDDSISGFFNIRPAARTPEMATSVLEWLSARGRELTGPETWLQIGTDARAPWRAKALLDYGMALVRQYWRMTCDVAAPIGPPTIPPGYTIRPIDSEAELLEWVEVFNRAFADHWSFAPESEARRREERAKPGYQESLDLVAVTDSDAIAGFSWSEVRDLGDHGREYWIFYLGTDPDHRRRGLGQALLTESMRALQAAGAAEVKLAVDSENETGATGLYERAGFQVESTAVVYRRRLGDL